MEVAEYKVMLKKRVCEMWKDGETLGMIRATFGIDDELVRKLTEGINRNLKVVKKGGIGEFNTEENLLI